MNCQHLLQRLEDDGTTLTCLVCGDDVTEGAEIVAIPGQLTNINDDPLLDYLRSGGVTTGDE